MTAMSVSMALKSREWRHTTPPTSRARARMSGNPKCPGPFSDRGHRGMRKTLGDRCRIVAVAQMMARLQREIVH